MKNEKKSENIKFLKTQKLIQNLLCPQIFSKHLE